MAIASESSDSSQAKEGKNSLHMEFGIDSAQCQCAIAVQEIIPL